jgi:hypothetical protein
VLDGGLWRAITAATERAVELHRAVAYGGCSGRQLRARALVVSDLRDGRARSARHLALVAGALKVVGRLGALGVALGQFGAYRKGFRGVTLCDPRSFEDGVSPRVSVLRWIERRAHERRHLGGCWGPSAVMTRRGLPATRRVGRWGSERGPPIGSVALDANRAPAVTDVVA